MSSTESKIKLIFEGAERGVAAAALKAKLAIKSVSDENDKLGKAGGKAEAALMGIGKGLLAVSSVGSAATTIAGVAAAATQASGALLLLPGALAAVKIGLGAIDMGAGDFLAAMGNLNDNKAFKKNMEAMGDSAKDVAGDIKIAHDSLAEGLGEKMFAGIDAKLKPLIASTLPQLKASYDSIAVSVNRTGHEILDMLGKSERQADLNKLIKDSGAIWDQLLKSVTPLSGAFLDIAVVGTEVLKDLTGGIGDSAKRFADFIKRARESQQLERWINSGVNAFKDMWHIVENVGSTIGSVFKGLGMSMGSPLKMLRDLTERMAEFMQSAAAQDGLRILGDGLRAIGEGVGQVAQVALTEIAKTLVSLAPVAGTVAKTLGTLLVGALTVLGPIIRTIADILAEFPAVTVAATVALVGFVAVMKSIKAVNAVSEFLGLGTAIGGAGDKAAGAAGKLDGFRSKLGLIKGVGAAIAVAAIAVELDKVNVAAAGGADKLGLMEGNLHNLVGAGEQLASGDFGGIFTDIGDELDQMVQKMQSGQSPIGQFFGWLKRQMTEPLPPLTFDVNTGPAVGQVDTFIKDVNSRTPQVNINGNTTGAGFALREVLAEIAAGKEFVTIDGKPMPAQQALDYVLGVINNSNGTVTVNGRTVPAGQALAEILNRTNGSRANIGVGANTAGANGSVAAFVNRWNGYTIQMNAVVSSRIGGLATGGPISGPGTGTSDTAGIYALSDGEYVATARQVDNAGGPEAFGRLMASLDRGQIPHLAAGGSVSPMRASARAAMRTPAASPGSSGGGTVVQFAGNTSDALATVIMGMIRQGKIQIKAA